MQKTYIYKYFGNDIFISFQWNKLNVAIVALYLEVHNNRNFLARTRNQPGIGFLALVLGIEIFELPGNWFWKIYIFLREPGSSGLTCGQTRKFLVSPGCSSFKI